MNRSTAPGKVSDISTITAVLEPDADGSLHLPLPPELRGTRVKVTAALEAAAVAARPRFGCLAGKIELAPDFDEPLEDFKDVSAPDNGLYMRIVQ